MNVLFQGYSALRGDKGAQQEGPETISKLCDRIKNATLLEDRRAAVLALRGVAREWKKQVGDKDLGMSALISVLRKDRMDVDILKASLETLNIVCTSDKPTEHYNGMTPSENLGLKYTANYTKDPANVTLLLDILEEVDFYVRFHTVQLLNTLLENSGKTLQECILTSPLGISRLIDLLDDRREIIRNEGLLLLISLSHNNPDIQKIIAFENAFERLLGIILDEGATDGGIIVQDCLQLIHNLLKYNVSNQNLFRETSCIQRIPSLLAVRTMLNDRPTPVDVPLTHESIVWTDQKITNANMVLDLVRILSAPKNPSAGVNQNVMHHAKIVPTLIEIALSVRIPTKVKAQALYALGDAMRGHKANQDVVSRTTVSSSGEIIPHGKNPGIPPVPTILQVIKSALDSRDLTERAASAYTFECHVYNNPDAQIAVLATLTPPPADNPNAEQSDKPESVGSLLVSSFDGWQKSHEEVALETNSGGRLLVEESRRDPFKVWFAAIMLSHSLNNNNQCQRWALSAKFREGEEVLSLIDKCMSALSNAVREEVVRVSIAILSMLCIWCHDCSDAVKELVPHLGFFLEQINPSSGLDPLVQGVMAYLVGLLYEYNDDSIKELPRANLQSLLTSRIGADVYASEIERLRESKELNGASQHIVKKDTPVGKDGLPEIYFDLLFVDLFKSTHDSIVKAITTVEPKGTSPKRKPGMSKRGHELQLLSHEGLKEADELVLQSFKDTVADQERELSTLRERVAALETQLQEQTTVYDQEVEFLQNTIENLQSALTQQNLNIESLQSALTQQNSNVESLQSALTQQHSKFSELEREHEDLLVCLADQDEQMKDYRRRLRAYREVIESDDSDEEGEAREGHIHTEGHVQPHTVPNQNGGKVDEVGKRLIQQDTVPSSVSDTGYETQIRTQHNTMPSFENQDISYTGYNSQTQQNAVQSSVNRAVSHTEYGKQTSPDDFTVIPQNELYGGGEPDTEPTPYNTGALFSQQLNQTDARDTPYDASTLFTQGPKSKDARDPFEMGSAATLFGAPRQVPTGQNYGQIAHESDQPDTAALFASHPSAYDSFL